MKRKKNWVWGVGLVYFFFPLATLYALPIEERVVAGEVTFERNLFHPHTLNVTVSDKSIIEWKSFNIAPHETVNFHLPSLEATSLNRLAGGETSQISGKLIANGNLVLVNPKGFYFAPTAAVGVGGIRVSTYPLTDQDFLTGRYLFPHPVTQLLPSPSSILNEGVIQARKGGSAILIADTIENRGTIEAPLGTVALARSRERYSPEKFFVTQDVSKLKSAVYVYEGLVYVENNFLHLGVLVQVGMRTEVGVKRPPETPQRFLRRDFAQAAFVEIGESMTEMEEAHRKVKRIKSL